MISLSVVVCNIFADRPPHTGWTDENGVLTNQIHLIANKIKLSSVDFIALEQATIGSSSSSKIVSRKLNESGLVGWTRIISACNKDTTQLAYSSIWEPVIEPAAHNPLLNGLSPQRGWVKQGCEADGNGRPCNIVYFINKHNHLRLLFVVTHMPHCHNTPSECFSKWNLDDFSQDVKEVVGSSTSLGGIHLIVSGDLNELGGNGDPNAFSNIFGSFGSLRISSKLLSCCANSDWAYGFDRVLTNSATSPNAVILDETHYPINPNRSGTIGPGELRYNIASRTVATGRPWSNGIAEAFGSTGRGDHAVPDGPT